MGTKIGRNDPCPCGSGRKYKQCCGVPHASTDSPPAKGHDGAVERALTWLTNKHRKAVAAAINDVVFEGLNDEECAALEQIDDETWQFIQRNVTEWLLAEGEIQVKGERRRVAEYLLGPGGPLLTIDQRNWIAQLGEQPLRLYLVTDVVPGARLTLCDALDSKALPITVLAASGSQTLEPGVHAGFRVMKVDDHHELSGAAYPFSRLAGPQVVEFLRDGAQDFKKRPEDLAAFISFGIMRKWLEQYVAPAQMPTLMDAYSGEPILLITDHYRVTDWDGLAAAVAAQADVEGDRSAGWSRFIDCEDGQRRSRVAVNIEKTPDRISLFYKTQNYADEGRPWFDQLAGGSVTFVARELTDLEGAMASKAKRPAQPRKSEMLDLPPEVAAEIIENTLRRMYGNWADEPIPALDHKTPRYAIKTKPGLERVKGLIRSYEAAEKQQAVQQGRRVISFDFLWNDLGISK
jgi:hypothetical protein